MDITEINSSICTLVHDIEIPLDVKGSMADAEMYRLTRDEAVTMFSPEYLKFLLADRRRVLYAVAVKHNKDGELFCLDDNIYRAFNFVEIALALDVFPNLNSVSFTTTPLPENTESILTFTDDANPALNAKVGVSALGIRLRDWFDEKATDEINRQVFIHNDKFNNAMTKDNLILINQFGSLLDICASAYASLGRNTENSTMPLFDTVPKALASTPTFIFTDFLEI